MPFGGHAARAFLTVKVFRADRARLCAGESTEVAEIEAETVESIHGIKRRVKRLNGVVQAFCLSSINVGRFLIRFFEDEEMI